MSNRFLPKIHTGSPLRCVRKINFSNYCAQGTAGFGEENSLYEFDDVVWRGHANVLEFRSAGTDLLFRLSTGDSSSDTFGYRIVSDHQKRRCFDGPMAGIDSLDPCCQSVP